MLLSADIWKVLAGVAIFILGAGFMDEAVKSLLSRKFKLYLKKHTSNKVKAIATGTFFSAALQSSSLVNLLVLSLAGAGVLQLSNALALVLGSNLGTVSTNWLIALFGFSFEIENIALPVAAISGISLVFISVYSRLYHWARLLLGFSFLFISLGFIKEGMAEILKHYDISVLNNYPLFVFTLAGFLLTSVIQSSSATMALALSALFVNAITLYEAMAVSLGAEAGSALKLFLASAKGHKIKKIIAVANFSFNVILSVIFLFLLKPLHNLVVHIFGINNHLIALVLFQTLVNFSGILLFGPYITRIAGFLGKIYRDKPETSLALHQVPVTETRSAFEALETDSKTFIRQVIHYCQSAAHLEGDHDAGNLSRQMSTRSVSEKYVLLKNIHGELHNYIICIGGTVLQKEETERLEQLVSCTRNGLYAAKSIKDAVADIEQLYNSSNDIKYNYYLVSRKKIEDFSNNAADILSGDRKHFPEEISALYKSIQAGYHESIKELYSKDFSHNLSDEELSTLFNFNREIYTTFKSIIFALKDFLLDFQEARKFDEIPGFIR